MNTTRGGIDASSRKSSLVITRFSLSNPSGAGRAPVAMTMCLARTVVSSFILISAGETNCEVPWNISMPTSIKSCSVRAGTALVNAVLERIKAAQSMPATGWMPIADI